ncbi:MAG: hypothetical protein KDA74_10290 [Planctomycetaceae bacterium]|nr:hypothetical protein [Planctomycetaceae bacterium]
MQVRRLSAIVGLPLLASLLYLCLSCSEQGSAPVEMDWCLADSGNVISNGFELRDGRVTGINLATVKDETVPAKLLALQDLETLRLTTQAFDTLGADAISSQLTKLNELCIRLEPLSENDQGTVTLNDYQRLLTLPHLKKLTVEILELNEDRDTHPARSISSLEQLDAAINLQSQLSSILSSLKLKRLRLQLTRDSRPLDVQDLQEINRQSDLESFTLFGPTLITFPGQPQVEPARIDFRQLKGLSRLQELSLCNVHFDPQGLLQLPQLKRLTIRECQLEASSFAVLLEHPSLQKIVVLGCTNEDLNLTRPLPPVDTKLKQIDLQMVSLAELKMFANVNCDLHVTLGNMNSERYLERFFCSLGDSIPQVGAPELQQLDQLKTMSEFELLHSVSGRIEPAILVRLAVLPGLRSLVVDGANLEKTMARLPPVDRLPRLQHLSLLTYPGPASGVLNQLLQPELRSLSLRSSRPREKQPFNPWKGLSVAPLSQLQQVELSDYRFLESGSRIPKQFLSPSLKQITFEFCDLDRDCLKQISAQAPRLKKFRMSGQSAISQESDLLLLNRFTNLEQVDLFDSDVTAKIAFQLQSRHVRIGGEEMFQW